MDRPVDLQSRDAVEFDGASTETFAEEFDRLIREDDGSAPEEILASGHPISIAHEDTPEGHVIRLYPDGHEELVKVDWDELALTLGR